jgi:hypothetical protein
VLHSRVNKCQLISTVGAKFYLLDISSARETRLPAHCNCTIRCNCLLSHTMCLTDEKHTLNSCRQTAHSKWPEQWAVELRLSEALVSFSSKQSKFNKTTADHSRSNKKKQPALTCVQTLKHIIALTETFILRRLNKKIFRTALVFLSL